VGRRTLRFRVEGPRHGRRAVSTAPELPDGLDWLNTSRPLTLADLRGRLAILDFWTYG